MKKFYLLTLIVALFAACTNDTTEDLSLSAPGTLKVSFDNQSRVELDHSSQTVWTKGDKVSVFHNSDSNDCYQYQGETGEREGILLRTAQGTATTTADKVVVVYPYNETYTISHATSSVDVTIPAVQYYKSGSYGVGANLMVATGTGDNFSLKSLCGWVKLQFKGSEKLTKITLRGNDDEQIAGSATANYDNYTLALIAANLGSSADGEVGGTLVTEEEYVTEITLDLGDGVQLTETPTDFYFTLAPQTFTKGITVTATADNGTYMTQTTDKEITISRNAIQPMAVVDYVGKVDIDPTAIPDNEIWYTTTDGKVITLNNAKTDWDYPETDFGANVISNEYKHGKGVIKFDDTIIQIGSWAFWRCSNLQTMIIPSQITVIEEYAFNNCTALESLILSCNLTSAGAYIFDNCIRLESFISEQASDDKKTLIVNSSIVGFAPYNISEYTTPQGVKDIGAGAFINAYMLKTITISEGVENIQFEAFQAQDPERDSFSAEYNLEATIEYVYLPSTLKTMHSYAFLFQNKIKGFYGASEFVSSDNKFVWQYDRWGRKTLCSFASGSNTTEYYIPEGIQVVEHYAFYKSDIESVIFPSSLLQCPSGYTFEHCHKLNNFSGKYATSDNKALCEDGTIYVLACAGLSEYTTPDEITAIGDGAFVNKDNLKHITLSDNVKYIYGSNNFGYCDNLQSVTLSARLLNMGSHTFYPAPKLESVYCRAVNPPGYDTPMSGTGEISAYFDFNFYVPKGSIDAYKSSTKFAAFMNIKEYNFENLPQVYYYYSTDYSADGNVVTLQTTTEGTGVDIVLMGDGYSDRQIADGTYKGVMQSAYEKFFSVEPYKSHKELFNVYYVTAVSATEGYDYGNTALSGYFGDGTLVGGSDSAAMNYALNAIDESRMEDANIVVMMNSENYAGTCYMYYPSQSGDYGRGVSVSYFPVGTDSSQLEQLLHHEACGHGFAKLADEYAYESMGAVAADYVSQIQSQQSDWGWWKNVDFTSDPAAVLWAKFIADSRYTAEGIGAFEGGLTYWTGVWRPTENSIMRYNTGGFNAPSREAIYYRIHKLAYGDSWQYDYEKFVEWDAINRTQTATPAAFDPMILRHREPTTPPVVVGKTWREAMQK